MFCIRILRIASVEKVDDKNFILHVASVEKTESATHEFTVNDTDCTLKIQYGDFSDALQKTVNALAEVSHLTASISSLALIIPI